MTVQERRDWLFTIIEAIFHGYHLNSFFRFFAKVYCVWLGNGIVVKCNRVTSE